MVKLLPIINSVVVHLHMDTDTVSGCIYGNFLPLHVAIVAISVFVATMEIKESVKNL